VTAPGGPGRDDRAVGDATEGRPGHPRGWPPSPFQLAPPKVGGQPPPTSHRRRARCRGASPATPAHAPARGRSGCPRAGGALHPLRRAHRQGVALAGGDGDLPRRRDARAPSPAGAGGRPVVRHLGRAGRARPGARRGPAAPDPLAVARGARLAGRRVPARQRPRRHRPDAPHRPVPGRASRRTGRTAGAARAVVAAAGAAARPAHDHVTGAAHLPPGRDDREPLPGGGAGLAGTGGRRGAGGAARGLRPRRRPPRPPLPAGGRPPPTTDPVAVGTDGVRGRGRAHRPRRVAPVPRRRTVGRCRGVVVHPVDRGDRLAAARDRRRRAATRPARRRPPHPAFVGVRGVVGDDRDRLRRRRRRVGDGGQPPVPVGARDRDHRRRDPAVPAGPGAARTRAPRWRGRSSSRACCRGWPTPCRRGWG
jgi:hypothetical protein